MERMEVPVVSLNYRGLRVFRDCIPKLLQPGPFHPVPLSAIAEGFR